MSKGSWRSKPLPPGWSKKRRRILRRDGGICQICHSPGADTVDHIIPAARGGSDDDDNLQSVHDKTPPHCHRVKTARESHPPRRRPPERHPGEL